MALIYLTFFVLVSHMEEDLCFSLGTITLINLDLTCNLGVSSSNVLGEVQQSSSLDDGASSEWSDTSGYGGILNLVHVNFQEDL